MNQNNTNPLVSIIINCYNGEKFLFEALDSVIKQTYKNCEVIFWDNHSTDQSKKIFFSYNEPRFRYYLADNHTNLYTARNLAIDKSKGEFIAFLDTDDWWEDTKLSKQLDYFKDSEVGLVYGNCWIVDERKRNKKIYIQNKKKLPTGFIFNQLLKEYVISLPQLNKPLLNLHLQQLNINQLGILLLSSHTLTLFFRSVLLGYQSLHSY